MERLSGARVRKLRFECGSSGYLRTEEQGQLGFRDTCRDLLGAVMSRPGTLCPQPDS